MATVKTVFRYSCRLPRGNLENRRPIFVSLVENACDRATNALKIIQGPRRNNSLPGKIALCVKNLQFPLLDISQKMIPWLETMRELKVDKVFVYYMNIHPNIMKMLNYYVEDGFLEIFNSPLPGNQPTSWLHSQMYITHR